MRGVTLEEISAATRISPRILKAIETGDLSKLPSGIFARSFVRQYARYLGLDEERVMAEYLLASPARSDIDLSRMTFPKPPAPTESPRATLLALIIATVMLVAGYLVYSSMRRSSEAPTTGLSAQATDHPGRGQSGPTSAPSAGAPASATVAGSSTVPTSASSAAPAATPGKTSVTAATGQPAPVVQPGGVAGASTPPAASEQLTLQVSATEKSWVAVEVDGKPTFQRILNPTEVETVEAKESFDVLTGNAGGIVLTLNGQTLSPLGGRHVTKRVHLTREDLKSPGP